MKVVITGESHCRTNLDVTERRLIPRRMISFEISAGRQFGDHDEMNWWHEMTLTLPLVADKTQMINAASCALTKKKWLSLQFHERHLFNNYLIVTLISIRDNGSIRVMNKECRKKERKRQRKETGDAICFGYGAKLGLVYGKKRFRQSVHSFCICLVKYNVQQWLPFGWQAPCTV